MTTISTIDGLSGDVLTKEERDALTPEDVVRRLKAGNKRFAAGEVTLRDHMAQVHKAAGGQSPAAIILSCVDSRVPVEDVFDQGIGDIFVARVAGNFVNVDMLGSMEFACAVAGSKLVLVLGHRYCGAVKGAIDDVKLGNLTGMLEKIQPAVRACSDHAGEHTTKNAAFVDSVIRKNVELNIDRIRAESRVLRELEVAGTIAIKGAVYDLDDGVVTFL